MKETIADRMRYSFNSSWRGVGPCGVECKISHIGAIQPPADPDKQRAASDQHATSSECERIGMTRSVLNFQLGTSKTVLDQMLKV
jgi:hypothetical protein